MTDTVTPKARFDYLNEQLAKDRKSGMVSYIDTTLDALATLAREHPEVVPDGVDLEQYIASLNEQVESLWEGA